MPGHVSPWDSPSFAAIRACRSWEERANQIRTRKRTVQEKQKSIRGADIGWSMDTAQRLARLAGVARFGRFLISGRPAQPEGNEAFRVLPCRCARQIEQALVLQRSEVQAPSKRKNPGWRVGLLGGLLLAD